MELQHYKILWYVELDLLSGYVTTTKRALDDVAAETVRRRDKRIAENPDRAESIHIETEEEVLRAQRSFHQLASAATLLIIWLFLERELETLCKALEPHHQFGLSLDHLGRGRNAIGKYRRYIEKGHGYRVPETNEWREIQMLNKVRNHLAHGMGALKRDGEGKLKKDSKTVSDYLTGKKTASIVRDMIVLTDKFCLDAIAMVRTFLLDQVATELPANLEIKDV